MPRRKSPGAKRRQKGRAARALEREQAGPQQQVDEASMLEAEIKRKARRMIRAQFGDMLKYPGMRALADKMVADIVANAGHLAKP